MNGMPAGRADEQLPDHRRARGSRITMATLHRRIAAEIAGIQTVDEWQCLLDFLARFPSRSFNNALLIRSQNPEATAVAGYDDWPRYGRHVKRGQAGIPIIEDASRTPPSSHTARHPGPASPRPSGSAASGRWAVGQVWDISQTEPLSRTPTHHNSVEELLKPLPRVSLTQLWDALARALSEERFELDDIVGGHPNSPDASTRVGSSAHGLEASSTDWTNRIVHVDTRRLGQVAAVAALAHQVAHIRMHTSTGPTAGMNVQCGGRHLLEAESVAYLVLARTAPTGSGSSANWTFSEPTSINPGHDHAGEMKKIGGRIQQHSTALAHRVVRHVENPAARLGARVNTGRQDTRAGRHADATAEARTAPIIAGDMDERLIAANETACAYYSNALTDPSGKIARTHLTERCIDLNSPPGRAALDLYKIGYAPGPAADPGTWTALIDHLRDCGFTDDELLAAGLATRSRRGTLIDRFRDRLVCPIRHESGPVVGFTGRDLSGRADDRIPKYLNTAETAHFQKRQLLLGLAEQRQTLGAGGWPLLVEGFTDALAITYTTRATPDWTSNDRDLAATGPGQYVPLATVGTALTAQHIAAIARHIRHDAGILVAFDPDNAGRQATVRAYDLLRHGIPDVPLAAVKLPGDDPAGLLQAAGPHHGPLVVRSALDLLAPLTDWIIDHRLAQWSAPADNAFARIEAARSIAKLIASLHPLDRGRQVDRVAEQLQIDPGDVRTFVHQATDQHNAPGPIRSREPVRGQWASASTRTRLRADSPRTPARADSAGQPAGVRTGRQSIRSTKRP